MKLTLTQQKQLKARLIEEQHGCCAMCLEPLDFTQATHLDHNHATGAIRGVTHAACNLLEGQLTNPRVRKYARSFARHIGDYLDWHDKNPRPELHVTHRTPDEKKERIKRRAKRKRDLNKAAQARSKRVTADGTIA